MNKINLFLATVFFILYHFDPVLGATVKMHGMEFKVNNINAIAPENGKPSFLSLDFVIYNATEIRKLDIPGSLNFSLLDEFGNHYARLDGINVAPHERSLYPKQSYKIQLAFELPVSKASGATLQFDGASLGIQEGMVAIQFALPKKANKLPSVYIAFPENGAIFERGMSIHLHVTIEGVRSPDGIIINAFDYTYEDRAPSLDNIYDLNIPADLVVGSQSINVIAKWKKDSERDNMTSSDNIVINIKDATPAGVL